MLSSTPPDPLPLADIRNFHRSEQLSGTDDVYHLWLKAVYAVVAGCMVFNLALAFINTNVTGISERHVILMELVLIAAAVMLALSKRAGFATILVVYLAYMALILALRPELDLKAIRDLLIPITFYFVGRKFRRIENADTLVLLAALLVVGVGMFEFLFLEMFVKFINIFNYYVARGTLGANDAHFIEGGSDLFISSTRLGGRFFFPFLGDMRASSVFLEPVSMGNFGAFLCLWAVFRNGMAHRRLLFLLAFLVLVLGDARFGIFVCLAFAVVWALYRFAPRPVWWALPFIISASLATYGLSSTALHWEDDLTGRLLHSGQLIAKLDAESLFGIKTDLPFLSDNGYAYSFSQTGLIGIAVLWTLFIFAGERGGPVDKFKALSATYICLLLVVSNSLFSIKTAALLWVCAGAVDAWRSGSDKPAPQYRKPGQIPALSRAVW